MVSIKIIKLHLCKNSKKWLVVQLNKLIKNQKNLIQVKVVNKQKIIYNKNYHNQQKKIKYRQIINFKFFKKELQNQIRQHFEKAYYNYKSNTEKIINRIADKLSNINIQDYNNQILQIEQLLQDLRQKQNSKSISYSQMLHELQGIENQLQMFISDHKQVTNQLDTIKNCKIQLQFDSKKILDLIRFEFLMYEKEEETEEESLLLFQSLEPQQKQQQNLQNKNPDYTIYDNNSNKLQKQNQNTNDATNLSFFQISQENTDLFFSNLYQNPNENNQKRIQKSVERKPLTRYQRCESMRAQNNLLPKVQNLQMTKQNSLLNTRCFRQRNNSSATESKTQQSSSKLDKIKSRLKNKKSKGHDRSKSPISGKKGKTLKVQRIQINKFQFEKILQKFQENSEISRINFRNNEFQIDPLDILYQYFNNTLTRCLTVDLRQNQIQYSQWLDSQKQKLDSKNIKILIQLKKDLLANS